MIRWRIGLSRISTLIGDLFFSIITVLVIFYFAQRANYLDLRFYLFAGSLLGLLIYIRYISRYIKRIINMVFDLISYIVNTLVGMVQSIFYGAGRFLAFLMSFPYRILRWLGLLCFRIGEAFGKEAYLKAKMKIGKIPKK